MNQYRFFSSVNNHLMSAQLRKEIVAPFKTSFMHNKVAVEKNIPYNKKTKAWEKDGANKEEWFKKKYAHVHANSKKSRDKFKPKEEKRSDNDTSDERNSKDYSDKPTRNFLDREFRNKLTSRSRENRDFKSHEREIDDYSYKPKRHYERDPIARLLPSPLHDYVYGVGPIIAALRSEKREVFTELLFHNPKERHEEIMALAKERDVFCKSSTKMVLNQLTNNNVHNGYVLKTKPLLPEEITKLGPVDSALGKYEILKNPFGQETLEEYEVARKVQGENKNPFGIYLDEISDPHNVGLIIRTAYFLGADFIVMSEKNCSKLTPVVSKSSSGAMEVLPIYSTNKPVDFFENSQKNGWKFISTIVGPSNKNSNKLTANDLKPQLDKSPCVLLFGSEGTGVRTNLITRSDFTVSLKGNRREMDKSIDSLNVSVAAGLLMQNFLL